MASQLVASKCPILREGLVGEVKCGKKWYDARIIEVNSTSTGELCRIEYLKRKNEYGEEVVEKEFRRLDCGAEPRVYVGMKTKCREQEPTATTNPAPTATKKRGHAGRSSSPKVATADVKEASRDSSSDPQDAKNHTKKAKVSTNEPQVEQEATSLTELSRDTDIVGKPVFVTDGNLNIQYQAKVKEVGEGEIKVQWGEGGWAKWVAAEKVTAIDVNTGRSSRSKTNFYHNSGSKREEETVEKTNRACKSTKKRARDSKRSRPNPEVGEPELQPYSEGVVLEFDGNDTIEFEFSASPMKRTKAKVTDLLYVGVPEADEVVPDLDNDESLEDDSSYDMELFGDSDDQDQEFHQEAKHASSEESGLFGTWGASERQSTWGAYERQTTGGASANNDMESSAKAKDILSSADATPKAKLPRTGKAKLPRTGIPDCAIRSSGGVEESKINSDEFLLKHIFKDRVRIRKYGISETEQIDPHLQVNGCDYVLVASKYEDLKEWSPSMEFNQPFVKAFYVAESGPNLARIDVQKELNGVANFSELALSPGKLASRLELLVSPAAGSKGSNPFKCMFNLPTSDFEEIDVPENQTMGCGFIPEGILNKLLGGGITASRAGAVQVRVAGPHIGIYKGMLVKKRGIKKIQLPSSMKKVAKAASKPYSFKGVLLMFNGFHPGPKHLSLGKFLNPEERPPTAGQLRNIKALGPMLKTLMRGCGVPDETLQEYQSGMRESWDQVGHEYLWGVCDCTNGGLPEGTVFIPGFQWANRSIRHVFVTRCPCTEKSDARMLPVVTTQPRSMSSKDWTFLCKLHFGLIVFASPRDPESKSLPEQIAGGDLDGDRFFVCWNNDILRTIPRNSGQDDEEETIAKNMNDEDDDDSLIGVGFPLSVDGEKLSAIITERTLDGMYLVKSGSHEVKMSRQEIMDGTEFVEGVVDHRGKGRNIQVEVLYANNQRRWMAMRDLKDEYPYNSLIADYAMKHNLVGKQDWKWTRDHIHDSEAVSIKGHRRINESLEVNVLYDDGECRWESADDCMDVGLLHRYAGESSINLDSKNWKWLKEAIGYEKEHWLANAQQCMGDLKKMADHSRFMKALHREHKKRNNILDKDSILLGRAYKQAQDIGKHGGRVSLPMYLRDAVLSKGTYANKFITIE